MGKHPAIENLRARPDLLGLARRQGRPYDRATVKRAQLEEMEAAGWQLLRNNNGSVTITRPKAKSDLLESRVWSVLYRMGFSHLSGQGGCSLILNGSDPKSPTQQIDVVAADGEVAIAVECKSQESRNKDPRFTEKLTKLSAIQWAFGESVAAALPKAPARHTAMVMFTWDIEIRETDQARAREEGVCLLDERDLEYYEALVTHLGQAARYQLLAELFKGRRIRGLLVRVPALRTKMGHLDCYTFSVRPDYLLKIAYVAHRAKGKTFDVDSYQRMLSKTRLTNIATYIDEDGIFPTNIVVNVADPKHLRFERGKQEAFGGHAGATFGWLTLSPTYGAAWVIDGQHRLFAYSGHPRAQTNYLNVLAFHSLKPSKQTELFVDINSEQRRVKRSLLVELDATLKWDSEDDQTRVNAIISRVGMALDERQESPLRDRVLLADVKRTPIRCVSLTSLFTSLNRPGFFIVTKRKGYTQYGALWRDDPNLCFRRAAEVVTSWLRAIASEAREWWELGAGEGGGLAMNDGVTVCMNLLRSVLEHLNTAGMLPTAEDDDLVARLRPYAKSIGSHFARMGPEERSIFRRFRGIEGQTNATRECQLALQEVYPNYQPEGLAEWIQRRDANTNEEARRIIDAMEKSIQETVLALLKAEFDSDENAWWFDGVPVAVRKKIDDRINEAGGGKREENFDLVHYEAIMKSNWQLFKQSFSYGNAHRGKERGTAWLREVAGWRNKVMHPSRRDFLGAEELTRLQEYYEWLQASLASTELEAT